MKDNLDQIFIDKLRISMSYLSKSLNIIEGYANLFRKIKMKQIDENRIDETEDYQELWQASYELYLALENRYCERLPSEKLKRIKEIVEKYTNRKKAATIQELKEFIDIIRYTLFINNFDDVTLSRNISQDFMKPRQQKW